jgi:hypothetical protein
MERNLFLSQKDFVKARFASTGQSAQASVDEL